MGAAIRLDARPSPYIAWKNCREAMGEVGQGTRDRPDCHSLLYSLNAAVYNRD